MRVRAIDKNGDWTFGHSRNNYKTGIEAVKQNVVTRIKSFKNDWFLDGEANIDWWNILGRTSNETIIKNQVYQTVITTYGVTSIKKIEIKSDSLTRKAQIFIKIGTIYDEDVQIELGVGL